MINIINYRLYEIINLLIRINLLIISIINLLKVLYLKNKNYEKN
ncbi:hypothetical protein [Candidatus Shikimatogenerans bostrichidophilus]